MQAVSQRNIVVPQGRNSNIHGSNKIHAKNRKPKASSNDFNDQVHFQPAKFGTSSCVKNRNTNRTIMSNMTLNTNVTDNTYNFDNNEVMMSFSIINHNLDQGFAFNGAQILSESSHESPSEEHVHIERPDNYYGEIEYYNMKAEDYNNYNYDAFVRHYEALDYTSILYGANRPLFIDTNYIRPIEKDEQESISDSSCSFTFTIDELQFLQFSSIDSPGDSNESRLFLDFGDSFITYNDIIKNTSFQYSSLSIEGFSSGSNNDDDEDILERLNVSIYDIIHHIKSEDNTFEHLMNLFKELMDNITDNFNNLPSIEIFINFDNSIEDSEESGSSEDNSLDRIEDDIITKRLRANYPKYR